MNRLNNINIYKEREREREREREKSSPNIKYSVVPAHSCASMNTQYFSSIIPWILEREDNRFVLTEYVYLHLLQKLQQKL